MSALYYGRSDLILHSFRINRRFLAQDVVPGSLRGRVRLQRCTDL